MKITDSGVLNPSFIDFAIPSSFARETLFYPTEFGQFSCNNQYKIERKYLDQYLIMYIDEGSLCIKSEGKEEEASAGESVLLDCRKPHAYWCRDHVAFRWFHFNGAAAESYTTFLKEKYGTCVMGTDEYGRIGECIGKMFVYLQAEDINEHKISLEINGILAELASEGETPVGGNLFGPVIRHIRSHYDEEIRLDDLMDICGLSKSYFIREFKKHVGSTPHEYLLAYRLKQAKQMLQTSGSSIEEISEQCGFNSTSHFARAFKKENQMTPTDFRNIRF